MSPRIYRPLRNGWHWRSFGHAAVRPIHPFVLVAAIVLLVATLTGAAADSATDPWLACTGPELTLPLRVTIGAGVDAGVVRAALAEWNALRPDTFVEVSSAADVQVVASTRTWVKMPCGTTSSTVYAGPDVNLPYWMAHEFGHTLRLADHIPATQGTAGYLNPKICPADGYVGVMSYCTPRTGWWGSGDRTMIGSVFPPKVTIPEGFEARYHSVAAGVAR